MGASYGATVALHAAVRTPVRSLAVLAEVTRMPPEVRAFFRRVAAPA